MDAEQLVSIHEFCFFNNAETSVVYALRNAGLITLVTKDDAAFITLDELPLLEKLLNLHYELDINIEGIETIVHLLTRTEALQAQIEELKSRLRISE